MKLSTLVFIIIFVFSVVRTADEGDWVDPYQLFQDMLVHPFYAGYLNITRTKALYYTFFPSQHNPDKDPLIVRISSLGCSPLYSAFYSKGPFIFVKNTKQFRFNPYNWNKQANILFIEGPAGVGFSKGSEQKYDDDTAARQYYFALERFYQKFPELKDQIMYLSGQQYAGIVVPRIAQIIVDYNKDPLTPSSMKMKLSGFILNNPITLADQYENGNQFTRYTMQYLKNHYFLSPEQYEQYRSNCVLHTDSCEKVIQSIQSKFLATGADLKNLYTQCISQQGEMKCVDTIGILSFLNDPKVKEVMNADTSVNWKFCNADIQKQWTRDPEGAVKTYQKLLRSQNNLKIWIISGGLSGNIPITGTKHWFEQVKRDLKLPMIRMWEPWFYNHTINAGDIEQLRGITLATVRSGGYLLWNDQPQIGYYIVDSFLKGNQL